MNSLPPLAANSNGTVSQPPSAFIVSHNRVREPSTLERLDSESLKQAYLDALASLTLNARSLKSAVSALLWRGSKRRDLVRWAVIAGYSESHIRSLLSRLLGELGQRERLPGAGRQFSPLALDLLKVAMERYGDQAEKILLSAYRAAKARRTPERGRPQPQPKTPGEVNE